MSNGLDFLSKTVLEYRNIEWTFSVKVKTGLLPFGFVKKTLIRKEIFSN